MKAYYWKTYLRVLSGGDRGEVGMDGQVKQAQGFHSGDRCSSVKPEVQLWVILTY